MCLAIPRKVASVKKGKIRLVLPFGEKEIAASLIRIKKGDWVLTQNNVIIRKIGAKEAGEINKILKIK